MEADLEGSVNPSERKHKNDICTNFLGLRNFRVNVNARFIWGVILNGILPLALILVAAALFYFPSHWAADLSPDPDSTEYAFGALNFIHGHGFTISAAGVYYPIRYSFGFPLLLSVAYLVTGQFLGHAIFVVFLSAVGSVFVVYLIARNLFGPWSALAAAVTVLSSADFEFITRYVLSDYSSAFLFCLLALTTYFIVKRRNFSAWWSLLYVVVCSMMIYVRFVDLLVVAANIVILSFAIKKRQIARRYVISLILTGLCSLVPTFVYNYLTFGGIFRTGYRYWVPEYFVKLHDTFAFTYIVSTHQLRVGITFGPNLAFYAKELAGRGFYFPFPMLALAYIGIITFLLRFRRYPTYKSFVLAFLIASWCVYLGTYLLYFFQDDRFLLPTVPTIAIFVGFCVHEHFLRWVVPVADVVRKTVATFAVSLPAIGLSIRIRMLAYPLTTLRANSRTILVSLFLSILLLIGMSDAYNNVVRPSYFYLEVIQHRSGVYGSRLDLYQSMDKICPVKCLVLSTDSPVYVEYLVRHASVVPAEHKYYERAIYGWTPTHMENPEKLALVRRALQDHVPVFYDLRFKANVRSGLYPPLLTMGDERLVINSDYYRVFELIPNGAGSLG